MWVKITAVLLVATISGCVAPNRFQRAGYKEVIINNLPVLVSIVETDNDTYDLDAVEGRSFTWGEERLVTQKRYREAALSTVMSYCGDGKRPHILDEQVPEFKAGSFFTIECRLER